MRRSPPAWSNHHRARRSRRGRRRRCKPLAARGSARAAGRSAGEAGVSRGLQSSGVTAPRRWTSTVTSHGSPTRTAASPSSTCQPAYCTKMRTATALEPLACNDPARAGHGKVRVNDQTPTPSSLRSPVSATRIKNSWPLSVGMSSATTRSRRCWDVRRRRCGSDCTAPASASIVRYGRRGCNVRRRLDMSQANGRSPAAARRTCCE